MAKKHPRPEDFNEDSGRDLDSGKKKPSREFHPGEDVDPESPDEKEELQDETDMTSEEREEQYEDVESPFPKTDRPKDDDLH